MDKFKHSAVGSQNQQAGRDIIQSYGLIAEALDLESVFKEVDDRVRDSTGDPISPKAHGEKVVFSAGRLFISLIEIGVRPEHSLSLIRVIDRYIKDEVPEQHEVSQKTKFSTAHIRLAVSKAILNSENININSSERTRLANKYARNYGNPSHELMVSFEDHSVSPLNYDYLKNQFIPHLIEKLTGYKASNLYGGSNERLLARANIDHMANEIIGSVRRLGIYQVRYATLVMIAEDLALQLPHPWLANDSNKQKLIQHDFERAENHFSNLTPNVNNNLLFWRTSLECFNHICSGILASYSCIIGGGQNAAPNTLRNFTRLGAEGERRNIALWNFCSIAKLEDDLEEIGTNIETFHRQVKNMQKICEKKRIPDKEIAIIILRDFLNVLKHVSASN